MQGKRAYPNAGGFLYLAEGEYGYNEILKQWEVRPFGHSAFLIHNALVVEHTDKTISVRDEIINVDVGQKGQRRPWRGYLKEGVWWEA